MARTDLRQTVGHTVETHRALDLGLQLSRCQHLAKQRQILSIR